jgi:hypothetical protein
MNTAYLDKALELAEAGRDPVAAMRNQDKVVSLLRRGRAEQATALGDVASPSGDKLAAVLDRLERVVSPLARPLAALGASKIVRVENTSALLPGQTSQPLKIEWPGGEGFASSMYATSLDGDPASLSRMSVRITINGTEDLFTTGQAPAFVPLIAFNPGTHAWFRLKGPNGEELGYPVSSLQKWAITFTYEGAAGPATITPVLLFAYATR